MARLDELKKRLKKQEDIYYEHYEDEEAFIPDLLDEADNVIHTQRLIIRKYKNLAEQGRLVELPCAKGDTVYFIHRGEIKKDIIGYISLDIYGNVLEIWLGANDNVLFRLNQAVFLTREEAEAKLKEMESNDR